MRKNLLWAGAACLTMSRAMLAGDAPTTRAVDAAAAFDVVPVGNIIWRADYGKASSGVAAQPATRDAGAQPDPKLVAVYERLKAAEKNADREYENATDRARNAAQANKQILESADRQKYVTGVVPAPADPHANVAYDRAVADYVAAYRKYGDPSGTLPDPEGFNKGTPGGHWVDFVDVLPDGRVLAYKGYDLVAHKPAQLWSVDPEKRTATLLLKDGDAAKHRTGDFDVGTLAVRPDENASTWYCVADRVGGTGVVTITGNINRGGASPSAAVMQWSAAKGLSCLLATGELIDGATVQFILRTSPHAGAAYVVCATGKNPRDARESLAVVLFSATGGQRHTVALLQRDAAASGGRDTYHLVGGALAESAALRNVSFSTGAFNWLGDSPAAIGTGEGGTRQAAVLTREGGLRRVVESGSARLCVAGDGTVARVDKSGPSRSPASGGESRLVLVKNDGATEEVLRTPCPAPGVSGQTISRVNPVAFSADGRLAMVADLSPSNGHAVYLFDTTTRTPPVLAGRVSNAAGGSSQSYLSEIDFDADGGMTVSFEQGDRGCAYHAQRGGVLEPLVSVGDVVTVPGDHFTVFSARALMVDGKTAVWANYMEMGRGIGPGWLLLPHAQ